MEAVLGSATQVKNFTSLPVWRFHLKYWSVRNDVKKMVSSAHTPTLHRSIEGDSVNGTSRACPGPAFTYKAASSGDMYGGVKVSFPHRTGTPSLAMQSKSMSFHCDCPEALGNLTIFEGLMSTWTSPCVCSLWATEIRAQWIHRKSSNNTEHKMQDRGLSSLVCAF